MTTIPLDKISAIGVVKDVPPYQLPPEAWNEALNVRCRDGSIEQLLGWAQTFGTPGVPPHFAIPLQTAAQTWWLYVSLTKGYVYDGSGHTNITRQTAMVDVDYTAAETKNWNGTVLGGIPILNNNNDIPQYWATPSIATKLANLPHWDSNIRALCIRAVGPYLVALNITDGGSAFPHQVLWSHPADPGSVPSSWDFTDPAVDAGLNELPDVNSGIILDGLTLKGSLYIYKEGAVWRMTPIGGRYVFKFETMLETAGILAQRCVAATGDGKYHVFLSQDDLVRHNGVEAVGLLSARMKKTLFNKIDTTNFGTSFVFCNPTYDEIWVCYPSAGATHADSALIWNYKTGEFGACTEADGITFRNAQVGVTTKDDLETWDTAVGSWNTDIAAWSTLQRRRVLLCAPDSTKFLLLDEGALRDGVAFEGLLQRTGLSVLGRDRQGNWINDFEVWKLFSRVWMKLRGEPVEVRVGVQKLVDGDISWDAAKTFSPTSMSGPASGMTVDKIASGRALALEIRGTGGFFSLDGYKVDVQPMGQF